MVLGSILGGMSGERWHSKLLVRALDPAIGPEGRTRRDAETSIEQAEARHTEAEDRVRMTRADRTDGTDRTRTDDERFAAAQRDEADQVADEQAAQDDATDERSAEIRSDGSHSKGRHFLHK